MFGRETFMAGIRCCSCGNTGHATFDEVENPLLLDGHLDRETIWVDAGFELSPRGHLHIVCGKCGSDQIQETPCRSAECVLFATSVGCEHCAEKAQCPDYETAMADSPSRRAAR